MVTVKVIKISGTNNALTAHASGVSGGKFIVNGEEVDFRDNSQVILPLNLDVFFESDFKKITGYKNGDLHMTVEKYKSLPTHYESSSSEEEVLRAIANRKEVAGFEPVYEPVRDRVTFDIVREIQNTNSKFITCHLTGIWSNAGDVVFYVNRSSIETDEYTKLAEKLSSHAAFSSGKDGSIEYAKIDKRFTFTKQGFGSRKTECYPDLAAAQKAESDARQAVRDIVNRHVFPEGISQPKATRLLSKIEMVRDMKGKRSKDKALDLVIADLKKYISKER